MTNPEALLRNAAERFAATPRTKLSEEIEPLIIQYADHRNGCDTCKRDLHSTRGGDCPVGRAFAIDVVVVQTKYLDAETKDLPALNAESLIEIVKSKSVQTMRDGRGRDVLVCPQCSRPFRTTSALERHRGSYHRTPAP